MLLLVVVALFGLRPWATDSLAPDLTISPGLGTGLADATVVAPPPPLEVEEAPVAVGRSTPVGRRVAPPAPVLLLGVSQSRPVEGPELVSLPPELPTPSPVTEPIAASPEPAPALPPGPVAASPARPGPQLVAGFDGDPQGAEEVQIHEGDEYAFAFSFYIEEMAYGMPGADNLIMQFRSDASASPFFGLQLWDYLENDGQDGGRGLWASGEAMGGDRFLAPALEQAWHEVVICFRASSQDEGFYEIYLDGELIDARYGISLIAPESSYAKLQVGLLRDADGVQGASEIHFSAARLSGMLEPVLP